MKESINGQLRLTEHQAYLNLISVAQRLMAISADLESIVSSGCLEDDCFNEQLFAIADNLRENVDTQLVPTIGTIAVGMQIAVI